MHTGDMAYVLQIKESLRQMQKLDKALQEKTVEQIMVARETAPEKWAERERRRLMRRQQHVTKLLERERQEHARRCGSPKLGLCRGLSLKPSACAAANKVIVTGCTIVEI
jgi:hypothetical protein